MKSIFTFLIFLLFASSVFAQSAVDVSTGADYANEVYYNFENDVLKTQARNSWDIAFNVSQMSVSVLANTGNGTMVYTWPNGNASNWETVDTTGMAWTPMYNSIYDWEYGAFNANTEPGNELDYGWGKYNITTHRISGDSIFIMKLSGGEYKKLLVEQKNAIKNEWIFKYADLDGTNDTTITLVPSDYSAKSFLHFSMLTNQVVEQEPAQRWQLLFTRYYDITIPYYVTGILTNSGVRVQQVNGVSQADYKDYNTAMSNDTISEIGSDWKSFSMATFKYEVASDVVYFVQDTTTIDKPIWKLYFTGFSGSASGTYSFIKEKMGPTSAQRFSEKNLTVYPNPANHKLNVIHDFNGTTSYTIFNIAGQPVFQIQNTEQSGLNKQTIDISHLPTGMYSVQVRSGANVKTVKFLKN